MGWLFCQTSKAALVQDRCRSWDNNGKHGETITHSLRSNVLWTVNIVTENGKEIARYIGCDLLQKSDGQWGYKDMSELVHPYYYDCPLKFLAMVPVACQLWRDKVKEFHAKQSRKFQLGETLTLTNCKIPSLVITSIKPLRGCYQGITYRIPKQLIA